MVGLLTKVVETLAKEQKVEVRRLQELAFTEVSDLEAEENFFHPESVHVLGYTGNELVGWAGIHETEQNFDGIKIKIGGYGICTHPRYQGKGIASVISKIAMSYLKEKNVDVGFLSVNPKSAVSIRLHEKNGFVMLPKRFSWTDSKGVLKFGEDGMLAPIRSKLMYDKIMNSKTDFYVGNGYW